MISNYHQKYIKYVNKNILFGNGIDDNRYIKIISQANLLKSDIQEKIKQAIISFGEFFGFGYPTELLDKFVTNTNNIFFLLLSNDDSLCVKKGEIISMLLYKKNRFMDDEEDNVTIVFTTESCRGKKEEKSYISYLFDILKNNVSRIEPENTTEKLNLVVYPSSHEYEDKLKKIYGKNGFVQYNSDYPVFMKYEKHK